MYYCCGITDAGKVRGHNEDAFLLNKTVMTDSQLECELNAPFIIAVADGVAGETSGEIASALALELLSHVRINRRTDYKKKIRDIHTHLKNHGRTHNNLNMQTTLCALAVEAGGEAFIINAGDSRIYRYRNGKIRQLSTDQSLVQILYQKGHITHEQLRNHNQKNIIFPVLGNVNSEPVIDVTAIEGGIEYGDLIILCTDGLSDSITEGEFEETLALPQKLPRRLARLVETACENGGSDNITAVILSVC